MKATYGKKNVNAVSRRLTVTTVEEVDIRDCKRDRFWPITEIASSAFPEERKFQKREPLNSYLSFGLLQGRKKKKCLQTILRFP